jgi:hypothetical protein
MNTDLIKNTGIQFINIPVKITDDILNSLIGIFSERVIDRTSNADVYTLLHPYYWKEEDIYIEYDSLNAEAFNHNGVIVPDKIRLDYTKQIEAEDIYKVRGAEVLSICEGHWIPLPYFRIKRDPMAPFHFGPENWCRVNLQKLKEPNDKYTHVVTLAFDTSTEDIESSNEYKKPRDTDANDNGSERFRCVLDKRTTPKFFTSEGLHDWMFNLFYLSNHKEKENCRLKYIAIYHVFLDLLNEVGGLVEIGLLSGDQSIDVGLVLDIGNSRTCGLLSEKNRPYDSAPFDFTNVRKLQIRNLTKPHEISDKPFDMQIAFSEEKFGNQSTELFEDVFVWPSLVRVGDEAIELTSIFESEDSLATMSSPKRYLWNKASTEVPWIKVDRDGRIGYHTSVDVRKNAIFGISDHVTSDGKLIRKKDRGSIFPATESRYSKSSLMMFAIYEILLHALSQINSKEFREDQGNSTYRRNLKDLVLTCPTAMTDQEQYALRKSAIDAVELINLSMGEKMHISEITVHPKLPSLDPLSEDKNPWKLDEATCSQLSFLYGEIAEKYKRNIDLFFDLKGKLTNIDDDSKSINIASIDIGGGTSDLMICNYSYDKKSDLPFIIPKPLFWEGFNVAGDDIIKRIIEHVFFPEIESYLTQKNAKNIGSILNKLFGPNVGGTSAKERIYRRQFANQVATPFAYEALEHVLFNDSNIETITLEDVFKKYPKPESSLLEYIDEKISKETGIDFSICNVVFNLNPLQINHGIKDVMNEVLDQLGHLISKFDCDLILLSGRPSRLPIIRKLITDNLLFAPDKVVSLGDYRFGYWYPFANSMGYVGDPKSTVSVGALIAYLNEQEILPGLRIDMSPLVNIGSTVNYLGVMNDDCDRILSKDILISPKQKEGIFKFYGESVIIGMKQLESDDWIASPLYLFDFKSTEKKAAFRREEFKYPLKITLKRLGNLGEFIDKEDLNIIDDKGTVVDNHYFIFNFSTVSRTQVHWKDSGSFIVNIENK